MRTIPARHGTFRTFRVFGSAALALSAAFAAFQFPAYSAATSLLVSDDVQGAVYRVSYLGE